MDSKNDKEPEDLRLNVIGNYVTKSFRFKPEKWLKVMENKDHRKVVKKWLGDPEEPLLVLYVNSGGVLVPSLQFPGVSKGKVTYFIRKMPVELTDTNIREVLKIGDVSAKPVDDLSALIDYGILPILENTQNRKGWPEIVVKEFGIQVQELRNSIAEVRGNVDNTTLLPMPLCIHKVMLVKAEIGRGNIAACDLGMKAQLEAITIKWSIQVEDVLKEDSEITFADDHNPTPAAEIEFWEQRFENLENLYLQLTDPRVKQIGAVLQAIDSVYYITFITTFKNVSAALMQASEITLYLKPLEKQFEKFLNEDFTKNLELIKPFLHCVCLFWGNCPYYANNSYFVKLFKMIHNLFIEEATKNLDPNSLFQQEYEDALKVLDKTIEIFQFYRAQYNYYKKQLKNYRDPGSKSIIWSFRDEHIFGRYDLFLKRIAEIRDVFDRANEFQKLEKVEIGGLQGRNISRNTQNIYEEFMVLYGKWSTIQFDLLDPNPKLKDFKNELKSFNEAADDLERKLAFQFNLAFDECFNLEQRIKLTQILGSLIDRPLIKGEIYDKIEYMVEMFQEELALIKRTFDDGTKNLKSGLNTLPIDRGFPTTSGAILFLRKLRNRLIQMDTNFGYIEIDLFQSINGNYARKQYYEMMKYLDDLEGSIFSAWTATVAGDIAEHMAKPLIKRNDKELLEMNFDPKLVEILKDMKYFSAWEYEELPEEAVEFYAKTEALWQARLSLSRIVEWYNDIHEKTVQCEFDLIAREVRAIDKKLTHLLTTITWDAYTQRRIKDVYNDLKDLHTRLMKTQENIEIIKRAIDAWGKRPLYQRKDGSTDGLIILVDCELSLEKRIIDCENTKVLIDNIMLENFRLFFNIKIAMIMEEEEMSEEGSTISSRASTNALAIEESFSFLEKGSQTEFEDMMEESDEEYYMRTSAQKLLFRPYEEYVDKIVGERIMDAVLTSIKYLYYEMDNRMDHNAPLFRVFLELQVPHMVFIPSLDLNDKSNGLNVIMQNLVIDIYNMTDKIPRIAQPPVIDRTDENGEIYEATYESVLRDSKDIEKIKTDMLQLCKQTIRETNEYIKIFDKYEYLWLDDRKVILNHFLKYGRNITVKEQEALENGTLTLKENYPNLDAFKLQIDFYIKLHDEVAKMEVSNVFRHWLLADFSHFKSAVLNTICKWSNTFKQYLKSQVIDSLKELDEFIDKSTVILKAPVTKDDLLMIIKIMSVLKDIKDREIFTDNMFEPLKNIVELLKAYEEEFSDTIMDLFETLPEDWLKLKKMAVVVKEVITPFKAYQVEIINRKVTLFTQRLKQFRDAFRKSEFFKFPCKRVYEKFDETNSELQEMEFQIDDLNKSTELFELVPVDDTKLLSCRRDLKMIKQLWDFVLTVDSCMNDWNNTLWKKIDVENMDQECKKYGKELRNLNKEMRNWEPYTYLESKLKNLITSLRAITELQNPAIRERHWTELMQATQVRFEMDDTTILADLLDLNLHKFEEDVKGIVDKSVKEMGMEKTIKDLNKIWKDLAFETEIHDRTKLKILKISDEVVETLEENQGQLQNLMSSKYIAHFYDEISTWQQKLSNADQVINTWFEVQRKWMYLESIFIGSEDIRSQLPEDAKRFDGIDRKFKELLMDMSKNYNVVEATNKPTLLPSLDNLLAELILCEKVVNDYLETKRLVYPRFYFVSSADLLDILSNGNRPELVCKHLPKLYDSLAKLKLEGRNALGMISKENDEYVGFEGGCDCSGKVEVWLNRVTETMRKILLKLFEDAVKAYVEKSRDVWVYDWPAQPALCTTQIWWTTEVNIAFGFLEEGYENSLKDYQKKQISQLNALIVLLLGNLTPGDRQKIMTICTIDVHSRDVVAKLIVQRTENASAFQWQCQLRHRWDDKKANCFANICDAEFKYDYEYLGNTPRLVITPLTDRCYITLTQSLHLIMGGAPAGPAGTGKTETTKDLGRALGIMVYVFNCSEQMDYKSCGNIYKGLAQTGAWGCFDEFNRISVEVLSVVAVQVKTVQDAIKAKKKIFNFLGEIIKLIPTVGMFITMNPGYAGRTELPENLKALFRPCAMVVPDFELICEIMLVAEGFQDARMLARKFITLYTLCKELLSKQDHYDWGLRAIKSVLVVAGSLKRDDRERPEDQVLMRALRDFNIPKIVTDDVTVFMGLIGDLFPALDVPRKRLIQFEKDITQATLDLNLQPEDGFVLKVVQLKELFDVRHSVFIIGFAGTGKSQVWRALYKTYQNDGLITGKKPFFNDLDPKAVTNDELFGIINPSTREWKDGLFSVIMRDQVNLPAGGSKWIVLDGDIDPMWIESLNTVMDDNKVLTLASNERIALTKDMRLLFEISNLRTATPATVSRAGILYINPQDLGWNPYIASWIQSRAEVDSTGKRIETPEMMYLTGLFDKYIPTLLNVSEKFKKITPISEIAMLQMTCFLLECLLTKQNVPKDCPKEWFELYFGFAVIWGFGSALFQDQLVDTRNEFSKWFVNEFKTIKFPAAATIYDYFIDPETKAFRPWSELITDFELDPDVPLQSTLVPTAETTRLRWFMDILIEKNHPIMLVGGAGSGKSVIVSEKLNNLPDKYAITNVPFNFYTTSEMLQKILEKPLEKKSGRTFGPPGNKTMIYFVDDMNMPKVDTYGTVQPHTIIREFFDYQHWYDRMKLSLKDIQNCQFVSSMNPKAGSFTIDSRLQRHFCVFAVSFPTNESLQLIYDSILVQHLENPVHKFKPVIKKMSSSIVAAAIALHSKVCKEILPTALKFHYIFNLRDLANIFQGMLFGNSETCPNPTSLVRLWIHEATRVYSDKLTDAADIDKFQKFIPDAVKTNIEEYDSTTVFNTPLIFCHFAGGLADSKYLQSSGFESLSALLTEAQVNYNELIGAINLVLFEDAIGHVCRINRILEGPRGNALLIGVGGSGKQSLARLAAFISNLDVFQVQLRKGYAIIDLKADLAVLYMKAGIKNAPCMFLMTDSQVAEEEFLVLINDMLASGEIPELFPDDEIDNIVNGVRNEVKQLGLMDTKEICWKYFIDKVRKQLKTVLCFSPVGSTLRVRARKFPAVVNCTAIDWFHEWPQNALESVSKRFLAEIQSLPDSLINSVGNYMAYVHGTVNEMSQIYFKNEKRYNYTTPKTFLELISLYSKLLEEKTKSLEEDIVRFENGILKIAVCAQQADLLQKQLVSQEVVLKEKNAAADQLIVIVSAENKKVQFEKDIAADEERKVRIIEEEVTKNKKICEEDLQKAQPTLLAAMEALNTLNKANLTELKSFGSPPEAVVRVLEAVLVLFAKNGKVPNDRSWKACKVMMGNVSQFIQELQNYDKEHIHPDNIKALLPYINHKEFIPEIIVSKSSAAAGLCSWVINIYRFYLIYLVVEPKQRRLDEALAQLSAAQDKLLTLNSQIQKLEDKLSIIQAEFDAALSDKKICQDEADKTSFKIDLATRLVGGLASEKIRWSESIISFKQQTLTMPGDVLLVSCFISYVGCFTRPYRVELQEKRWIPTFKVTKPAIPYTEGVDPLSLVCDDALVASWNNEGLPSDRMSAENATILMNSARWPLMIDPQLQGIKWIKQKYGKDLVILRLNAKNYLDSIEKAIVNGSILLIENIGETIDAVLDPLLGRALIKKGRVLKMGEKEVDFNQKFRLILHTKLANPHYKPEMQAQTTLINFTVTKDGLEDQLLAEVVKAERPDLEALKSELTTQQNSFKITLKKLEDDLLSRLASAGENVLDDPKLVLNLEKTKKTAADIEIKVKEAKITTVEIDTARENYRVVAKRAAILYFILNDLYKINRIYQFSLKAYIVVFKDAMMKTTQAEELTDRVANLIDSISFSVFMYTSRSLFEKDKIIFQAQMTIQILLQDKEISKKELDFLLRFPYTPDQTSPVDFLTHIGWGGIMALSKMDEFQLLDKDIEGSVTRWRKFVEFECPEREKLPGEWKKKSALQRLCIMRALRPDRMTYAITAFVEEKLGTRYIEARQVDFAVSFEESSSSTPIFFILSAGVDPLKDVEKIGRRLKFSSDLNNFYNVSLGQGQEIVAENCIELAAKNGHWVILQNIHLVAKWLATLEKKMESTLEYADEDYRLFISAEPAAAPEYHIIPQGILESAIKITNEPPTGMLANVHKALDNFNQETLEMCTKETEFKAILFALCYFHAVVAERRKFGAQGWNRNYPFNFGDLTISVYVLYNYLEANNRVPWEDLRYLFGEIMYGGHITDDWDRKLCRTYLEEFMQPELVNGDLYLATGFLAPPNTDYMGFHNYIDDYLPAESPYLYGLHPNAEIGFLAAVSETIFNTIFELQPRDSEGASEETVSREDAVKEIIKDLKSKLPTNSFNLAEMGKVEDKTPFVIVALQECERMNTLVNEIKRSLNELSLGIKGELTITSDMEDLDAALFFDIVPETWTKRAYPSMLKLQAWFSDLLLRLEQLGHWSSFNFPPTTWLGGFFNPQSFLTAIMQTTARKNEWPLDKMCLSCDVTKKDFFAAPPREGAYVKGLFMEGARWDTNIGSIAPSHLKDLFPVMPVIFIKAVTQDKQDSKNIYECPVYKTRQRGPTFVWTFNLKTKIKAAKWTLAGVCLLLQI